MCVMCRRRKPKAELLRVHLVADDSGTRLQHDQTGKGQGRGAYVCDCVAMDEGRVKGLSPRLAAALGASGETIDTTQLVAWARQRTENLDGG